MLVETPQPKSMPAPKPKHPGNIQAASQTLKVYPNPSQGRFIFEYNYSGISSNELLIEIINIDGILIDKIRLTGLSGIYIWDGEKNSPGSYLYKISAGSRIMDSGLITIIR